MFVVMTLGGVRDSLTPTDMEEVENTGGCSFTGVTKMGRMRESM